MTKSRRQPELSKSDKKLMESSKKHLEAMPLFTLGIVLTAWLAISGALRTSDMTAVIPTTTTTSPAGASLPSTVTPEISNESTSSTTIIHYAGMNITLVSVGEGVFNHNVTQLDLDVITDVYERFNHMNLTDVVIVNDYTEKWDNSYCSSDGIDTEHVDEVHVYMGNLEDNFNLYNLVLTHEYMHHVLFSLGVDNGDTGAPYGWQWQEALADSYTWLKEPAQQAKEWGVDDSNRTYPYNIIIPTVMRKGKMDCLDAAFKNVSSFDSLISNYDRSCDINTTELVIAAQPDYGNWVIMTSISTDGGLME